MGKNLTQQKRGKGSPTFRAPSFKYIGRAKHRTISERTMSGVVTDLVHCAGHTSPLAKIMFEDGETSLMIAPEGIRVGDAIKTGPEAEQKIGNTLPLQNIPEGTLIYNIESKQGDGGKFVRASGGFARVMAKFKDKILVQLPSKKQREFPLNCRASIGVIAGSGRKEKPFVKAGKKYHQMRARNRYYPNVSALSMNAVDHPFGGSRSSKLGKSAIAPKNAPPGRKVGLLRPRRTGRRK